MEGFQKGRLILPVELAVFFRDSLRNRWEQKSELLLDKVLGAEVKVTESMQIIFDSAPENEERQKRKAASNQ